MPYIIGNHSLIKRINRARIMNLLRLRGPLSRSEMTRVTGLDPKSLTNIAGDLLAEGLIESCGYRKEGIGRPLEMLRVSGSGDAVIGISLKPGEAAALLCDIGGSVIVGRRLSIRDHDGTGAWLDPVFEIVDDLMAASSSSVRGIGLSVPGVIAPDGSSLVISVNMPAVRDVPVVEMLSERYHLPVYMEDSSRCMAIAERWFGQAQGTENFILVDMDIGIGLGIYSNGSVYYGTTRSSGEIGHTVVDRSGPPCYCGNRGCLEAMASGRILLEKASSVTWKGAPIDSFDGMRAAAAGGCGRIAELLREAGEYIGIAVANVINLFNPSLIVFAGPLSWEGSLLFETAVSELSHHTLSSSLRGLGIITSKVDDSPTRGAAALALRDIYEVEGLLTT